MQIHFLGTGGYHPTEKRHTSCVVIPELGIVFDAGSGFFRVKERLATPELHVFFSHYHEDHVSGIVDMFDVIAGKKFRTLHLYGRAVRGSISKRFQHPWFPVPLAKHPFLSVFHSWRAPSTKWQVGLAQITARQFLHTSPGGVLGYSLQYRRKKVVYLTDTTVSDKAHSLVKEADLLICECNFPNGNEALARQTGHSWPAIVAQLAKDSGVKKLALTHVGPGHDDAKRLKQEAEEVFGPMVCVAEDGLGLQV